MPTLKRRTTVALLGSLLLLGSVSTAPRSQAQAPPQSSAYGHTLSEWMGIYFRSYFTGGPDTVGRVKLLPFPAGTYVSGAGSPDDPALFVGHLDLTLKPGTPFVLPITTLYGESYLPEAGFPSNPDPVFPRSFFDSSIVKIVVDGKTIIDGDREDKFRYYVGPVFFDPPILYAQPTGYGSLSADFIQGFIFAHPPLSKGVHTMSLESSNGIPGGGVYPNAPTGFGTRYRNTWTITVK